MAAEVMLKTSTIIIHHSDWDQYQGQGWKCGKWKSRRQHLPLPFGHWLLFRRSTALVFHRWPCFPVDFRARPWQALAPPIAFPQFVAWYKSIKMSSIKIRWRPPVSRLKCRGSPSKPAPFQRMPPHCCLGLKTFYEWKSSEKTLRDCFPDDVDS